MERHRRTIEIADFLKIKPVIFEDKLLRLMRHILNVFKTLATIQRIKPKVLIILNPSIVLTLLACLLHNIYEYKLIVDSYNAGIIPENNLLKKLGFFYRYFQRSADLTIVTNRALAEIVEKNRGKSFILPDRIPQPHATEKIQLKGRYNIAYICNFKHDEPFQEVIEAVKGLDSDIVGRLKSVGKVYPQAVVDTYGSYAFEFLNTGKLSECAVAVFHSDVLPFYQEQVIEIGALLTDNGREFCGTDAHPFELYLALSDIEHRRTRIRTPKTNASWSGSMGRCWTSSSGRRSGRSSTNPWILSNPTSTNGWFTAIPNVPTVATGTWDRGRWRQSTRF